MASPSHFKLSTRVLLAFVALAALVAILLFSMLLAVLFLRPAFLNRAILPIEPLPSLTPVAADSGPGTPALVVAGEAGPELAWPVGATSPTPNPLRAKAVVAGAPARPAWTATPLPTPTPIPTPTPNPTFVSSAYGLGDYMPDNLAPNERWIDVDLSDQKLVAYEGLLPVYESLVSTGKAQYPTVTGQFRIWLRFRSQDMDGYRLGYNYYLRDVPFVQYFYQDYALHGTFWHSNFGTPMSHGCVNLSPEAARWLYDFAGYGTLVNVHP